MANKKKDIVVETVGKINESLKKSIVNLANQSSNYSRGKFFTNEFDEDEYEIVTNINCHKDYKIIIDDIEFVFIIVPNYNEIHIHINSETIDNFYSIIAIYDFNTKTIKFEPAFNQLIKNEIKDKILYYAKKFKFKLEVPEDAEEIANYFNN